MTSTIRCVVHHRLVSVTWDLRGVQCCCAVSGLLGSEVMSLGKWFSVFSKHYSPLKHWNHLPSDITSYPRRPEHSCLKQSGGFVKKHMVLQFLTVFYSCRSNQYQCITPQTVIIEGLQHSSQCLTVFSSLNTVEVILHKLHQRKKMKM